MNVLHSFSLRGKVALVTGGAGLFGRQISEALVEAGARTFIASRNIANLENVASELRSIGGDDGADNGGDNGHNVKALHLDLSDENSIAFAVQNVVEQAGRLDILVNNAVSRHACDSWNLSMSTFDQSLRVNASGTFCITRLAAEEMKKHNSGSIINIGSYMGLCSPNPLNYSGTDMNSAFASPAYFYEKGGVANFTRFAANALGPYGIRVNAVHPGGLWNNQNEQFVRNYSANTMLGRMATNTDLKGIIVFLASNASLYVTGTNIPVDGGYTAR